MVIMSPLGTFSFINQAIIGIICLHAAKTANSPTCLLILTPKNTSYRLIAFISPLFLYLVLFFLHPQHFSHPDDFYTSYSLFQFSEFIFNQMQYNKPDSDSQLLKILIIGNSGVGKSCMLMRYVENNFTTAFYNTIGVDFKMKNVEVDGKKLRLQIWDTAGQDRFRTITSTYYKGAHGIIIVYDVTDRESFEGLRFWLQEIDKYASQGVDKLIVGNKSDQLDKRKVSFEEGYDLAKTFKLEFTEVSALNAENIGRAFQLLARKVMKRLTVTPQAVNRLPQRLQSNKKKESSGVCC